MNKERTAQLVNELFVSNLQDSLNFYTKLGFATERAHDHFAVLSWGDALLFLDQRAIENRPIYANMNIRVLVDDVAPYWQMAQANTYPVHQTLGNRYYGMRDFTISDPDGFGIRFAMFI